MIHMKNIITIFLRHNGLESENYFIILYIYIKNTFCLRKMIMIFMYHICSFPYFLWVCYAFFVLILRETFRLSSKMILLYCKLLITFRSIFWIFKYFTINLYPT